MGGSVVWGGVRVGLRACAAAAVAAIVLLAPSVVGAEQVVNLTFTASGTATNFCNGEDIAFESRIHILANVTLDQGGGVHFVSETNTEGTGTGLVTGARYVITGASHDNFNNTGGAFESTLTASVRVIGQGRVPNFLMQTLIHVTFDANGQPTASVEQVRFICQ